MFRDRLNNSSVPKVRKFQLIERFISTFHVLSFFSPALSFHSVCCRVGVNSVSIWTLRIELYLKAQCEGLLFTRLQSAYHFSHCLVHYLLLGNISFVEVSGLTQALEKHISFIIGNENSNLDIWDQRLLYCMFVFILTGSCKNTWDGRY